MTITKTQLREWKDAHEYMTLLRRDRDRLRRWLKRWLRRSAGFIDATGDGEGVEWAAIDLGELRAALRGEDPPGRKT